MLEAPASFQRVMEPEEMAAIDSSITVLSVLTAFAHNYCYVLLSTYGNLA